MKKHNQKKEIIWNLINSLLAGLLVFAGAFSDGEITHKECLIVGAAALSVIVIKFKDYWDGEKKEYATHAFNFV